MRYLLLRALDLRLLRAELKSFQGAFTTLICATAPDTESRADGSFARLRPAENNIRVQLHHLLQTPANLLFPNPHLSQVFPSSPSPSSHPSKTLKPLIILTTVSCQNTKTPKHQLPHHQPPQREEQNANQSRSYRDSNSGPRNVRPSRDGIRIRCDNQLHYTTAQSAIFETCTCARFILRLRRGSDDDRSKRQSAIPVERVCSYFSLSFQFLYFILDWLANLIEECFLKFPSWKGTSVTRERLTNERCS